jgi:endonuclease/exonuclease/phosphatase family metal-dependent hydrolase
MFNFNFSAVARHCVLVLAWMSLLMMKVPASEKSVRVATFNVQELNWKKLNEVDGNGRGTHPQLKAAAVIIQRVRPDVLLLNEIDYCGPVDADGEPAADRDALRTFHTRYLMHPQNGAEPIEFSHLFCRASNTGVPSGLDLNNDGQLNGPADAFGYGRYPGEYAMAILSRYPLDNKRARTFRKLLWKDVPGHVMPDGHDGRPVFYSSSSAAAMRLSSKSHWDVPVQVNDTCIHLLCSHPTPPIFDGPEDANGRRNFDELRFWSDYLTDGSVAQWIRDDAGRLGGLPQTEPFVILGDLNAEPVRSSHAYGRRPIEWVTKHPRVFDPLPRSDGGAGSENPDQLADYLPFKTTEFGRLDYALPSDGLSVVGSRVFWPSHQEQAHTIAKTASDHRLVWVDIQVGGE